MLISFTAPDNTMREVLLKGELAQARQIPLSDWPDIEDYAVYVVVLGNGILIRRLYRTADSFIACDSSNVQETIPCHQISQLWKVERIYPKGFLKTPQKKIFNIHVPGSALARP